MTQFQSSDPKTAPPQHKRPEWFVPAVTGVLAISGLGALVTGTTYYDEHVLQPHRIQATNPIREEVWSKHLAPRFGKLEDYYELSSLRILREPSITGIVAEAQETHSVTHGFFTGVEFRLEGVDRRFFVGVESLYKYSGVRVQPGVSLTVYPDMTDFVRDPRQLMENLDKPYVRWDVTKIVAENK